MYAHEYANDAYRHANEACEEANDAYANEASAHRHANDACQQANNARIRLFALTAELEATTEGWYRRRCHPPGHNPVPHSGFKCSTGHGCMECTCVCANDAYRHANMHASRPMKSGIVLCM